MTRILAVSVVLSLVAGGLSGCYVVSPYAAPAYAAPYPPPPQSAPPPGQAPGAPGVAPGSAQNCRTVTVEGHAEYLVRQNGQRESVWVPTHSKQVCQ
jgi:hypothetical protein